MGSVHRGTAPPAGGRPRPGFPPPAAGAARHARPGQHPLLSLTRTCPQAPRQSPSTFQSPLHRASSVASGSTRLEASVLTETAVPGPHCFAPDRGAASGSRRDSFARGLIGRALAGPRAHAWSRTHPGGRCRGGGLSTPNIYSANAPAALGKPKYFLLLVRECSMSRTLQVGSRAGPMQAGGVL